MESRRMVLELQGQSEAVPKTSPFGSRETCPISGVWVSWICACGFLACASRFRTSQSRHLQTQHGYEKIPVVHSCAAARIEARNIPVKGSHYAKKGKKGSAQRVTSCTTIFQKHWQSPSLFLFIHRRVSLLS